MTSVGSHDSHMTLQVDVLETQFSLLLEKVSSTHDYETIKHAHEKYLTTLQSQLFLTQPSVSSYNAPC